MLFLFALLFIWTTVFAFPSQTGSVQKVYQFPNNTWVENIAVRSNGNLLVSLITSPEVWEIDPSTKTAELLFTFPKVTSALGIAEYELDKFAVVVGNFSLATGATTKGSWEVWSVRGKREVKRISDIPSAVFLNGATTLPTAKDTVLISDSSAGAVYNFNTRTGASRVVISDPVLQPNASARPVIGVNGIHYREGYLYFTNTFQAPLLARIPVSPKDGSQIGPVQVIANTPSFPSFANGDDFALDKVGNAWITTASNTLVRVSPVGKQVVVAGEEDSQALKGCTSAAFGRSQRDRDTLYVVTSGGLADPSLGVVGGGVYAVDTGRL